MSWVFAVIGQNLSPQVEILSQIHTVPLVSFKTETLYLAAGGLKQTCLHHFGPIDGKPGGWLVLGTGIRLHDGYCALLSKAEWGEVLDEPTPRLEKLDGHFVALRWNESTVECFSDRFGLRTLFILKKDASVAIATRLDWLSHWTGGLDIDFAQFGSHWLTFNQFSHESLLQKVKRLGPGGRGVCSRESVSLQSNPWLPSGSVSSEEEARTKLLSFLHPEIKSEATMSLGLSGGLDSRLLLALLLSAGRQRFSVHSFGHSQEPDVKIAGRIAKDEHLHHEVLDDSVPGPQALVPQLQDYVAQTYLAAPASSWIKLRYYPRLHAQHKCVIDGGMGEIARRQFLNRLLHRGKKVFRRGNARLMYPYLRVHRPSIFTEDVDRQMQAGVMAQLEQVWLEMPSPETIGVENFLDLLIVRYRFPNYGGVDQARMDGEIVSYMPFAQPSFVDAAFSLPLPIKKNGRLFRKLIRAHRRGLTHYPLVKGTITYPFILPTIPAWAYTTVKKRLGFAYHDRSGVEMLHVLSEYVRDLVHSTSVRTCAAYHHSAIQKMVEQFYSGRVELVHQVDWWLSFELWRQSLKGR